MRLVPKKPYFSLFLQIIPRHLHLRLLLTLTTVGTAAVCNVVAPIFLKKIIDALVVNPNAVEITALFVLFSITLVFGRILFEAKFAIYVKWEQALIKNGFNYVFKHTQQNTAAYLKANLPGTITSRLFQSLLGLKVFLFDSIFHMLPLLIESILILVAIAVIISSKIMFTIGLGAVLYALCLTIFNSKLLAEQNEVRNATILSQGGATDLIHCWKDVKLTNGYQLTETIFGKMVDNMCAKNLAFYQKRSLYGIFQSLPLCILFICANYEAISEYISGLSSVGNLLLINSYLWQIMRPLETFGVLFRNISQAFSDFTAIDKLLGNDQENISPELPTKTETSCLCIRNLNKADILRDVSITLDKGEKVALIGESGSGKTTLLSIISGLDTDYSGEILLGDVNIRDIPVNLLRKNVTLLASDSRIITGTIHDNLLLGGQADLFKVNQALNDAHIYSKIHELPLNLGTSVSETSNILSTGELQRLKLARTLLLNGPIKLFDESTSSMDPFLEEKIVDTLLADKESTVLFVTHRISQLLKFDRVLIMKNGAIIENGCHDRLMENEGEYSRIWKSQFQLNGLATNN